MSDGKPPLRERVALAIKKDRTRAEGDLQLLSQAAIFLVEVRRKVGPTHAEYAMGAYNQVCDAQDSVESLIRELKRQLEGSVEIEEEVEVEIIDDPSRLVFVEQFDPVLAILEPSLATTYSIHVKGELDGSEGDVGSDSLEQEGGGDGS